MPPSIFYTVLVVATLYTFLSFLGWIEVARRRCEIKQYCELEGKRVPPFHPRGIGLALDAIFIVYWIWMIVRAFVG
jgi:hypothetical protein